MGGAGNDTLEGFAGNDKIVGGSGRDITSGGEGDDIIDGGNDDDLVWSGKGVDRVVSPPGRDERRDARFEDTLLAATPEELIFAEFSEDDGVSLQGAESMDSGALGESSEEYGFSGTVGPLWMQPVFGNTTYHAEGLGSGYEFWPFEINREDQFGAVVDFDLGYGGAAAGSDLYYKQTSVSVGQSASVKIRANDDDLWEGTEDFTAYFSSAIVSSDPGAFIIVDYPSTGQPSTDPDGDPFSATAYIVDGELTPYDSRGALDEATEESGALLKVGEPYPLDILLKDWPNVTDDYVLTYPSSIVIRLNGSVFPSGSVIPSLSTGFEIEALTPVSNAIVSLDWTAGWNGGMVDRVRISAEIVDVDSDANNDGFFNVIDEPIEANDPGQIIGLNIDDDDGNDQYDLLTSGQVIAEDDLVELPLAINTANLPGSLSDWTATVVITGSSVKLWGSADKAANLPTNGGAIEWSLTSPQPELWSEGIAVGGSTIELTVTNPFTELTVQDAVRVTVVQLTLNLHDGQAGAVAPKKTGAFTVANVNDTNGDGHMDSHVGEPDGRAHSTTITAGATIGSDTITVADGSGFRVNDIILVGTSLTSWEQRLIGNIAGNTIILDAELSRDYSSGGFAGHGGRDEVDLMKLVIMPPSANHGGNLTLSLKSGNAKLWEQPWKGTEVAFGAIPVNSIPAGGKVLWVEAPTYSNAVRDIEIELTYGRAKDAVLATAIWALPGAVAHDQQTAAALLQQPAWAQTPDNIRQGLEQHGGTGLRPGKAGAVGQSGTGFEDVIMMQFQVTPAAVIHEPRITFDITRQVDMRSWTKRGAGQWAIDEQEFARPSFESPNDDAHDTDESALPSNDGRLYVIDGPGLQEYYTVNRNDDDTGRNFKEWVRIAFGQQRPQGQTASETIWGSQASDFVLWSHRQTLRTKAGSNPEHLERTTGDNPEVFGTNHIGLGHTTLPSH